MSPLLNIIDLQDEETPIDRARSENKPNCVCVLKTAMVCYFNIMN